MIMLGMILGALAGLFVVGPIVWVFAGAIFGEGSFADRLGWLGFGAIAGLIMAILGGSVAQSAVDKFRLQQSQQEFYDRQNKDE